MPAVNRKISVINLSVKMGIMLFLHSKPRFSTKLAKHYSARGSLKANEEVITKRFFVTPETRWNQFHGNIKN